MYGLFTKVGAGAVFSAGLSVLGIGMFCADDVPNHHSTPAVAAIAADAAIGAQVGVGSNPGNPSHGPGNSNPGNTNPGHTNPGNTNPGHTNPGNTNPGNTNPGTNNPPHQNPPPNCGCDDDDAIVVVAPELDVDLDVDLDADVALPHISIGSIVPGSDCGCDSGARPLGLGVTLLTLGH